MLKGALVDNTAADHLDDELLGSRPQFLSDE
jgi:hypothetical protein